VNGILFNHESPRRGGTFVTKKVTRVVTQIVDYLKKKADTTRDSADVKRNRTDAVEPGESSGPKLILGTLWHVLGILLFRKPRCQARLGSRQGLREGNVDDAADHQA
jgi:hypothetical protein